MLTYISGEVRRTKFMMIRIKQMKKKLEKLF